MKPLDVSRDALRAEITYDPLVANSAMPCTALLLCCTLGVKMQVLRWADGKMLRNYE